MGAIIDCDCMDADENRRRRLLNDTTSSTTTTNSESLITQPLNNEQRTLKRKRKPTPRKLPSNENDGRHSDDESYISISDTELTPDIQQQLMAVAQSQLEGLPTSNSGNDVLMNMSPKTIEQFLQQSVPETPKTISLSNHSSPNTYTSSLNAAAPNANEPGGGNKNVTFLNSITVDEDDNTTPPLPQSGYPAAEAPKDNKKGMVFLGAYDDNKEGSPDVPVTNMHTLRTEEKEIDPMRIQSMLSQEYGDDIKDMLAAQYPMSNNTEEESDLYTSESMEEAEILEIERRKSAVVDGQLNDDIEMMNEINKEMDKMKNEKINKKQNLFRHKSAFKWNVEDVEEQNKEMQAHLAHLISQHNNQLENYPSTTP